MERFLEDFVYCFKFLLWLVHVGVFSRSRPFSHCSPRNSRAISHIPNVFTLFRCRLSSDAVKSDCAFLVSIMKTSTVFDHAQTLNVGIRVLSGDHKDVRSAPLTLFINEKAKTHPAVNGSAEATFHAGELIKQQRLTIQHGELSLEITLGLGKKTEGFETPTKTAPSSINQPSGQNFQTPSKKNQIIDSATEPVAVSHTGDDWDDLRRQQERDRKRMRAIDLLCKGGNFIKHPIGRGRPTSKTVYLQDSMVCWGDRDPKPTVRSLLTPSKQSVKGIHLQDVREVVSGKQTKAFSKKSAASADASICFSVVTPDRTLDLQCPNPEVQKEWIEGLRLLSSLSKTAAVESVADLAFSTSAAGDAATNTKRCGSPLKKNAAPSNTLPTVIPFSSHKRQTGEIIRVRMAHTPFTVLLLRF